MESEISALRAEFSARPLIAAQTPRVGRLVGAGTEPEDEDEADLELDVVPRVDGAPRRQNTARSVHSDCDLREQQPRGRWASVTPEASPERSVDEEVDAGQRGRSPMVLGCGRLKLKKAPQSRETRRQEWSRRQGHAAPWVLPGNWYPGSTTRTGVLEERQVQKNAAGPPSLPDCASRSRRLLWKRELKEIKRARQQLEVAGAEDREDVATGDPLHGAAFVPPVLGAVQRQKRSRS